MPVSGLPAQGGGTRRKRGRDVTDRWDVRAVLLDMDGTLLDTERVYFDSLIAALTASLPVSGSARLESPGARWKLDFKSRGEAP